MSTETQSKLPIELFQRLAEGHNPAYGVDGSYEPDFDYEEIITSLSQHVMGLVAENVALKSFGNRLDEMHNDLNGSGTGIQGGAEVACQQVALEAAMEEFDAIQTPATNAAIAEIKASELDDLAKSIMEYAPVIESDEYYVYEAIAKDVTDRAAGLRAGRKG